MNVLLLSPDPLLVNTLTDVAREFDIETQSTADSQQASEQLNRTRYEGVVVDFDSVSDARQFIDVVRTSRASKHAIVFVIATGISHIERALQDRVHFVLRRPVGADVIRKTLRNAHDLMSGRHRRNFRCSATLPVTLTASLSGVSIECKTMNVSSNGMGVTTPAALKIADVLEIALVLPDGFTIHATGIVIWDDQHGKSGVNFQCSEHEMRQKLDSWLDSQFTMSRAQGAL